MTYQTLADIRKRAREARSFYYEETARLHMPMAAENLADTLEEIIRMADAELGDNRIGGDPDDEEGLC